MNALRRLIGHTFVYLGVKLLPDEEERAQAYADMRTEEILREPATAKDSE